MKIPEELLSSENKNAGQGGDKTEVEMPQQQQLGMRALFERANVRRNSLVLFTNWALVSLGYYGISMSSGSLNDNIFISYFLLSLIGSRGLWLEMLLRLYPTFQFFRDPVLPLLHVYSGPYRSETPVYLVHVFDWNIHPNLCHGGRRATEDTPCPHR